MDDNSKWRDFADAPKDGTWILIRGRNTIKQPMVPVVAAFNPAGTMHWGWVDSGSFRLVESIVAYGCDWQPLPSWGDERAALAKGDER